MRRYLDGHTHVPMRIEIRMKKLNSKSWSWVRVNGLARRDKQRRPVMLVGVWVNITRRKRRNCVLRRTGTCFIP